MTVWLVVGYLVVALAIDARYPRDDTRRAAWALCSLLWLPTLVVGLPLVVAHRLFGWRP